MAHLHRDVVVAEATLGRLDVRSLLHNPVFQIEFTEQVGEPAVVVHRPSGWAVMPNPKPENGFLVGIEGAGAKSKGLFIWRRFVVLLSHLCHEPEINELA